ncbi:hypothetical protein PGT21_018188 [Puccinia graminis f. sp. tritici]|nr:hypothetical protein PGT21_018188 [Puccinia graminis f. sp. tritici]
MLCNPTTHQLGGKQEKHPVPSNFSTDSLHKGHMKTYLCKASKNKRRRVIWKQIIEQPSCQDISPNDPLNPCQKQISSRIDIPSCSKFSPESSMHCNPTTVILTEESGNVGVMSPPNVRVNFLNSPHTKSSTASCSCLEQYLPKHRMSSENNLANLTNKSFATKSNLIDIQTSYKHGAQDFQSNQFPKQAFARLGMHCCKKIMHHTPNPVISKGNFGKNKLVNSTPANTNHLEKFQKMHFSHSCGCPDEAIHSDKMRSMCHLHSSSSSRKPNTTVNKVVSNNQIRKRPFCYCMSHSCPSNQCQRPIESTVARSCCEESHPWSHKKDLINSINLKNIPMPPYDISQEILFAHQERPFNTLVFTSGVFRTKDESSHIDSKQISKICSLIDERTKSLVLDESKPNEAYTKFLKLCAFQDTQTDSNPSQNIKNHVLKQAKRSKLIKDSYKEFWSQRSLWFQFYHTKTGVKFEDLEFQSHEKLRKEEIVDQFLLFLFYVDMITSIIVKVEEKSSNQDIQKNYNSDKIKSAERYFQSIFQDSNSSKQEQDQLDQESQNSSQTFTENQTDNVVGFPKGRTGLMIWKIIEKWLEFEQETKNLHYILFNKQNKKYSKLFFEDIFCYSITYFNKIIAQNNIKY